jgi:prepilin-type N-terminal cleavage/methylation domain-containing protein/prepilin-type processing-associated H-X9-DG protein
MQQNRAERHGFTLIELLVVIAIISIIAGFLVPVLLRGRGEAYVVQCGSQLKQIYGYALAYSDKSGSRAFPIASTKNTPAHDSINVLLEFDSEGLQPKMFICPEGDATAGEADATTGKFVVDENNLSYTWVSKRVKNTALNTALSSDKYIEGYEDAGGVHQGHKKGLNVLMTDGSVNFTNENDPVLNEEKLPKGLTR